MQRAFPGGGPEVAARYERAAHFLLATVFEREKSREWCGRKSVPIVKAQGEAIDSAGGFLVPVELEQAILDLRDSFGAFRRRARPWPMRRDSAIFPRRAVGATAYFFGEGVSAQTAAAGTITVDAVELTAKKAGALVILSSELAEDSAHDIVDYVANEIAWALAAKEDDSCFNGDGSSQYGGIRGIGTIVLDGAHAKAKVTAASGHNTYALLDGTDLGSLMGAVRASALPRAAWFMSVTGFAQSLVRLASAGGGYLYDGVIDGIPTPFYNGFPVIMTQKLPLISTSLTGQMMMAFGDLYAGAVLGQRRGLTIARSDHRYLDTDQVAILGTERFDAAVHDMGDNSNFGSIAALVAP